MKLKAGKGGGWERVVWRGLALPSDWPPPLPHNKVLRLVAAPELTHARESGGGATRSELSVIHADSSSLKQTWCSETDTIHAYLLLLHLQLNNAALTGRSGEGLLGFTASLYSYVNGESLGCSKAVSRILGKRIRGEFAPGLLACWGELWGLIVGIFSVFFFFNECYVVCAPRRPGCPKCAQVVERAHLISSHRGSAWSVCKWTDRWLKCSATISSNLTANTETPALSLWCFNWTFAAVCVLVVRLSWLSWNFHPPESKHTSVMTPKLSGSIKWPFLRINISRKCNPIMGFLKSVSMADYF